jgi:hypothetical protein
MWMLSYASRQKISTATKDHQMRRLYFVSGLRANITDDFVVSAINSSVTEDAR